MLFEYDPRKSDANHVKHGIGFAEARALWDDMDRIELAARSETESRYAVIGNIAGVMWTVICTNRGETVRIISARRSRKEEAALYEREKNTIR